MVKWDFSTDNKQAKRILRLLEVWITKNYGKPCKNKAHHCSTCQAWSAFEHLKLSL